MDANNTNGGGNMNTNGEHTGLSKNMITVVVAVSIIVTIVLSVIIFTLIITQRRHVYALLEEQNERDIRIANQQRMMNNMQEQMDNLYADYSAIIDNMAAEIDGLQYTIEELTVALPLGVTTETVLSTVQQAAELTTLIHDYTDIMIMDEGNFFTRRLLIIRYTGRVRAGIDFAGVDVDVRGQTIYITMPAARVFSHELPFETIEVVRDETGIFTPSNTIPDFVDMMAELQRSREIDLINAGILDDARDNSQDTIRQMINAMILAQRGTPADYTIVFR